MLATAYQRGRACCKLREVGSRRRTLQDLHADATIVHFPLQRLDARVGRAKGGSATVENGAGMGFPMLVMLVMDWCEGRTVGTVA